MSLLLYTFALNQSISLLYLFMYYYHPPNNHSQKPDSLLSPSLLFPLLPPPNSYQSYSTSSKFLSIPPQISVGSGSSLSNATGDTWSNRTASNNLITSFFRGHFPYGVQGYAPKNKCDHITSLLRTSRSTLPYMSESKFTIQYAVWS